MESGMDGDIIIGQYDINSSTSQHNMTIIFMDSDFDKAALYQQYDNGLSQHMTITNPEPNMNKVTILEQSDTSNVTLHNMDAMQTEPDSNREGMCQQFDGSDSVSLHNMDLMKLEPELEETHVPQYETQFSRMKEEEMIPMTYVTVNSESKDDSWDKDEVTLENHGMYLEEDEGHSLLELTGHHQEDSSVSGNTPLDQFQSEYQQDHFCLRCGVEIKNLSYQNLSTGLCTNCLSVVDTQVSPSPRNSSLHKEEFEEKNEVQIPKKYECEQCHKQFSYNNLKRHAIRVHSEDKPFRCTDCARQFASQRDLMRHVLIHSGDRPFKCEICGKVFSYLWNLKRHSFLHSGQKPFECKICNKRFSAMKGLRSHTAIHSEQRPYACEVCNKQFREKAKLVIHTRRHTGERPFQCNKCSSAFAQRSSLTRHINRSH